MMKLYGILSTILIILISISGCLSNSDEKTAEIIIWIPDVKEDVIINYNLYNVIDDQDLEEIVHFNYTFNIGLGQRRHIDVPLKDYSWYFTIKIINISNPGSIIQYEEIFIEHPVDTYTFYVYNIGINKNITIEHWGGGGFP